MRMKPRNTTGRNTDMSNAEHRPAIVVILAAGMGKRMNSELPKTMIPVDGRPMIDYVVDVARSIDPAKVIVVVGFKREIIVNHFASSDIEFAVQEQQLGTGDAVAATLSLLGDQPADIVVLSGDVPLIRTETIQALLAKHRADTNVVTLLTCKLDDPASYGRILRDGEKVTGIVEAKDATSEQLAINEINSGIYVFDSRFLMNSLPKISNDNAQGEYYLTDLVTLAAHNNLHLQASSVDDPMEIYGANTAEESLFLDKEMKRRRTA